MYCDLAQKVGLQSFFVKLYFLNIFGKMFS